MFSSDRESDDVAKRKEEAWLSIRECTSGGRERTSAAFPVVGFQWSHSTREHQLTFSCRG